MTSPTPPDAATLARLTPERLRQMVKAVYDAGQMAGMRAQEQDFSDDELTEAVHQAEAATLGDEIVSALALAWQPMDTAPKDGTPFLAVVKTTCGLSIQVVKRSTHRPGIVISIPGSWANPAIAWCALPPAPPTGPREET